MSTQRIKYCDHKFKEGHKITGKFYVSKITGAKYRVILNLQDPDNLEYYIRNERTKQYVFKSGQYTNLNVLKRKAREELERFGVPLDKESRQRSFGLCEKGYSQKDWENNELYGEKEK